MTGHDPAPLTVGEIVAIRAIIATHGEEALREARAKAWDEGAEAAWNRSTPEVNGLRYHWRSEGEPINPYREEKRR